MRSKKFSVGWPSVFALFIATLLVPVTRALAQQYTELHSFSGINGDGSYPYGGVISDPSGNLYGTTYKGGFYGYGTVFELMPQAGGGWTEKVLHICNPNSKSPTLPQAGLIFDATGNLYGTSGAGGIYNQGTVFELLPAADGSWTEKTFVGQVNTALYRLARRNRHQVLRKGELPSCRITGKLARAGESMMR